MLCLGPIEMLCVISESCFKGTILQRSYYGKYHSLLNLLTIDHLNLKLLILIAILQVLRFGFKKFRILEVLNFHPCELAHYIFTVQVVRVQWLRYRVLNKKMTRD